MIPKQKRVTDRKYKRWIKTLGCLVAGRLDACNGPIDPDHSTPRSLGGSDLTCLPLCRHHHDLANRRDLFEQRYAILLKYEVERLNREYLSLHPQPRKERKASMKVKVSVSNCEICGGSHEGVPIQKLRVSAKGVTLTCVRRNKELRIA